ncbi:AAA family ATPase [Patescibacteria group bacterium]|nr:AAA family ATPase [Patescibacteria group bacterium]MBU1895263.1 AAA family ATPase [Patescibacteria group bacterium]
MKAIIGHKRILEYFAKVIASGNLSHAYCLVGPDQVGKRTLAESISAELFNVESEKLGLQPDFLQIKQGVDEKTGKTKKDISIEQLRQASSFFSSYAFLGGYKIAIINPAERMSLAAANGLLKTLEEPRSNTLLFLITTDEKKLPQTIRSRCQTVFFSPVAQAEIEKALLGLEIESEKTEELSRLSGGLPGKAISWADDASEYEKYKKEIIRFNELPFCPFYDKIKRVEDLFGDKKDHTKARGKLIKTLALWQLIIRDHIYSTLERNESVFKSSTLSKIDLKTSVAIYKKIVEAKRDLRNNIHPRLLIEQILLQIP